MGHSSGDEPGAPTDLLINIIETLEAQGLDREEFQLHDYIDVDALEQILYSSTEEVEIQFTVEEIRLAVTPESVALLKSYSSDILSSETAGRWKLPTIRGVAIHLDFFETVRFV
jgi:hypothetical protein